MLNELSANQSPANNYPPQKIFVWSTDEWGWRAFQSLTEWIVSQQISTKLVGVALSTQDDYAPLIEKLAMNWQAVIYINQDPITVTADLGLNFGYPFPISQIIIKQFPLGIMEIIDPLTADNAYLTAELAAQRQDFLSHCFTQIFRRSVTTHGPKSNQSPAKN